MKCEVVTDVAARRGILRRKGKCFVCLKSGHIMRDCPSRLRCFKCGGFHHTALCGNVPKRERKPTPEQPKQEVVAASTVCVDHQTSVLLQTAQSLVGPPNDPRNKVNARVIFDSCSQRSYVTHRLQHALKLPVVGNDNLLIKAFGDESPRLRSCDLVQLALISDDGMELYVNAYNVPTICNPLSNQAVEVAVQEYPHLRGLQLTDNHEARSEVEIDVLIGADSILLELLHWGN